MSDYDRYANTRYGAGLARSGVAVDQGLRAYMLGVYNYMTLGLGVTGLVAYGAFALADVQLRGRACGFRQRVWPAIYTSPLRWVIILAPLALVFWLSARINSISVASAAQRLHRLRRADRPVDVDAAPGLHRRFDRARFLRHRCGFRQPQPLRLYDPARSVGDGVVHDDGRRRPHRRKPAQRVPGAQHAPAVGISILCVIIFAGLTAWDTQAIKAMYFAGRRL